MTPAVIHRVTTLDLNFQQRPWPFADERRADIDAHFAEPATHRAEIHQIWNYWFVPELYTYLRTSPEKVIRRDRVGLKRFLKENKT